MGVSVAVGSLVAVDVGSGGVVAVDASATVGSTTAVVSVAAGSVGGAVVAVESDELPQAASSKMNKAVMM